MAGAGPAQEPGDGAWLRQHGEGRRYFASFSKTGRIRSSADLRLASELA
jgi:hypothetical protein